jgi:hypothetical protein
VTRLLALLVALSVALIVAVAYAVVIIPDHDSIPGNTLTAAPMATAGEPFLTVAEGVFEAPVPTEVDAYQSLTVPADCSFTPPSPQTFRIWADGLEEIRAEWLVTCSAGSHELTATLSIAPANPHVFDPDPTNNSMSDSLTVVVGG